MKIYTCSFGQKLIWGEGRLKFHLAGRSMRFRRTVPDESSASVSRSLHESSVNCSSCRSCWLRSGGPICALVDSALSVFSTKKNIPKLTSPVLVKLKRRPFSKTLNRRGQLEIPGFVMDKFSIILHHSIAVSMLDLKSFEGQSIQ